MSLPKTKTVMRVLVQPIVINRRQYLYITVGYEGTQALDRPPNARSHSHGFEFS